MPWTQGDIETLKQAILARKGARSITFSDQSVTFDSIDDMLKLLGVMQNEVTSTAGGSTTRYAATRKGV
jgi:hypothetical protein